MFDTFILGYNMPLAVQLTFADPREELVDPLHGNDNPSPEHLSYQHLHDKGRQRKRHVEDEVWDQKRS